ncbi:hypothetical protein EIP91_009351 [Steccherinum ochraceum]|uniref:Uncharacterized protein n=1 Tax=Steccherinum ochraceum TaxID=92696 RepID=A0A4R0RKF4_9APHY|nr:hypothetical protein EIP91_009351 [Steccherinum ochraceum]
MKPAPTTLLAFILLVLAQSVLGLPNQVRPRGPVLLPQPPTVSCFTRQREALTPNINHRPETFDSSSTETDAGYLPFGFRSRSVTPHSWDSWDSHSPEPTIDDEFV